jgi:hypothetical protein
MSQYYNNLNKMTEIVRINIFRYFLLAIFLVLIPLSLFIHVKVYSYFVLLTRTLELLQSVIPLIFGFILTSFVLIVNKVDDELLASDIRAYKLNSKLSSLHNTIQLFYITLILLFTQLVTNSILNLYVNPAFIIHANLEHFSKGWLIGILGQTILNFLIVLKFLGLITSIMHKKFLLRANSSNFKTEI